MSKEDLSQIKIKRGQIKAQLTRFKQFSDELNDSRVTATQLQLRISKAEELWDQFDNIQTEIECKFPDESSEDDRIDFENTFFAAIPAAREHLETIMRSNMPVPPLVVAATDSTPSADFQAQARLPPLQLPIFSGNYTEWISFRDSFRSSVDANPNLSKMQKFQYLCGQLRGEAKQTIQAVAMSEENYATAWDLLQNRYENKRFIINTHLKGLHEIPHTKENHVILRQFIDNIRTHTRSLISLGEPVDKWDTILVFLLTEKIDHNTRKEWETKLSNRALEKRKELPTLEEFLEFLTGKCQTLEMTASNKLSFATVKHQFNKGSDKNISLTSTCQEQPLHTCEYCKQSHFIFNCTEFLKLSATRRIEEVKKIQLCLNCLRSGHFAKDCKSSNCRKCSKHHNTLLHQQNNISQQRNQASADNSTANISHEVVTTHCALDHQPHILLSTVLIEIFDRDGNAHQCRGLLDAGSQSHFIRQDLCRKLKLSCENISMPVVGVNQSSTLISHCTQAKIKSRYNNFTSLIKCLIVPEVTDKLPQVNIDVKKLNIPDNIKLADPKFHIPGTIDILIGAELFWRLICVGQIHLARNQPTLQKTQYGWIISGAIHNEPQIQNSLCNLVTMTNMENQLEQFWNIEEIPERKHYSKEELYCEEHFRETVTRDTDGRFIVCLPKRESVELGDSLETAIKRFYSLEKRLSRDPNLKLAYDKFLREYEELQHMSLTETFTNSETQTNIFYLPHHPVLKENNITTKIRVVFDGSAKTSLGTSLNDLLPVGPTIQNDLINIMLRFRCYQYVLTADVAMMYRQVKVHEADRDLQRICWRYHSDQPVSVYKLNTVTYGTSTAPFLAIRCLQQLAIEDGPRFPLAERALREDFYVDDVITGAHTKAETIELQKQLANLLAQGGFPLRKWRSNDHSILSHMTSEPADSMVIVGKDEPIKTLGLLWNSQSDEFQYRISLNTSDKVTKRAILSKLSQIFDPLGLIGPVITCAKLIMQQLWQLNIAWDESVPYAIHTSWTQYSKQLHVINTLHIPRNINLDNNKESFTIHGFCDASMQAYGACIYVVSSNSQGIKTSNLLCAKSRIAPLKTITLPRLELCGALLLSKLISIVKASLGFRIQNIYLWTDSTIVLAWIKTSPSQLKIFVANRVAEIQRLTADLAWFHVSSTHNPADIISRGSTADALLTNQLWWSGPNWLASENLWPIQQIKPLNNDTDMEFKSNVMVLVTTQSFHVLTKYSSFHKLCRVIAYCQRFIHNAQNRHSRNTGPLTVRELDKAHTTILSIVQLESFAPELKDLKHKHMVSKRSKLLRLHPFLDENNLIRVGGRLKNANIPFTQKYPYVLPSDHFVTELIIQEEHKRLLHCGHEQLLSSLRLKYWPLSGRRLIKKITHNCIQCFRVNPKKTEPIMGDLPSSVVFEPTRPFSRTGVDYAGPILIREHRRRGRVQTSKAYIAVFVCFTTRAVHLELVSSLTSEAFLAALRRFTARRGICSEMFSDNGTNFVGANQQLSEIYDFISQNDAEISTELAKQQITWKFIPPRSPHFGGIWESAVKTTKRHLYRVTQNLMLTFEECYTLLTGIESCLNSRPLTPLSSNPNDFTALTPSHFLIGDSLLEPPERHYLTIPDNQLTRYQHIQKVRQHFWQRWSREYLHQLQTRSKWHTESKNLEIGTMVLLIEDNLPPLQWILARITAVHPGKDNVVRVVSVKTARGVYKRSVRKLCALPL